MLNWSFLKFPTPFGAWSIDNIIVIKMIEFLKLVASLMKCNVFYYFSPRLVVDIELHWEHTNVGIV